MDVEYSYDILNVRSFMRCLEYAPSVRLLDEWGFKIGDARQLSVEKNKRVILTEVPQDAFLMFNFANDIIKWLPSHDERAIWPVYWNTDPIAQASIIEQIRNSYGEERNIIATPGMFFKEPKEKENAIITGMLFLMMTFDWSAYLITKEGDYIHIFDTLIKFSFSKDEKANELNSIFRSYDLKIMT